MRRLAVHIIIVQILIIGNQLFGWGYDEHRRISRAAIEAVSGEFGDFLQNNVDALSYNAANPDFWKKVDPDEFPRHFIDADLYDEYPFDKMPRDLDQVYAQYGEENVNQWGIAPWVIKDYYFRIIDLFKNKKWNESIHAMSAMSHYIADLHMPLHTCANYNGQLTGNEGIHFRWEKSLVEEYVDEIIPNGSAEYIDDPVEMSFTIVKESFSVYPELLKADTKARAPLTEVQADSLNTYKKLTFEDKYLAVLYDETSEILHERLNSAAQRIASYWYSCWIKAGSPKIQ